MIVLDIGGNDLTPWKINNNKSYDKGLIDWLSIIKLFIIFSVEVLFPKEHLNRPTGHSRGIKTKVRIALEKSKQIRNLLSSRTLQKDYYDGPSDSVEYLQKNLPLTAAENTKVGSSRISPGEGFLHIFTVALDRLYLV